MMTEDYFDLGDLVELLKEQDPERHELAQNLASLKGRLEIRRAYIPIGSTEQLIGQTGSSPIVETVVLEHPSEGTLVLDILENGELHGIEMINQIPQG
jgi:hypothetical protein